MKVLMVFPYYATSYRTGMISVLNNLPESLKKKNCEVKTIMFTDSEKASNETDSKDDILIYAKKVNLLSLRHLASEVKRETLNERYDIVHGHTGTSVLYKALGSNVPACVTNHGIGYKVYHFYWKYRVVKSRSDFLPYLNYFPKKVFDTIIGRLLYGLADRVTTVSSFTKHEVSEIYGVPEEKIDPVPNGVQTDLFTPNIPKEEKEKIMERYDLEKALLFLPPVPRKGLHLLIRALPAIVKEVPNLKLLVVGAIPTSDAYYKFCHELSKRLNVEERVLFVGWIDDGDLPKYYSVASAYVLPTLYEALPITVLESMACGTPVCASRWGGLLEIITDGEDGLLFDPTNTASLADALVTILSDDTLQRRMSFNARKKIERQYSWGHIADQYIKVYEKTIQNLHSRN
ncbi:MAG: glycosyltransferase family 4 protein [Candidatus Jordarchaeaceae archaeon]